MGMVIWGQAAHKYTSQTASLAVGGNGRLSTGTPQHYIRDTGNIARNIFWLTFQTLSHTHLFFYIKWPVYLRIKKGIKRCGWCELKASAIFLHSNNASPGRVGHISVAADMKSVAVKEVEDWKFWQQFWELYYGTAAPATIYFPQPARQSLALLILQVSVTANYSATAILPSSLVLNASETK